MNPRRREWTGRALLFAGGVAVSVAIAELVLQSLPGSEPRQAPPLALLRENPHGTGSYRLRPDLQLTARVGWREIPVETNSHGMRWREIPVDKPAGVRRVAVLGDSFAFGCWSSSIETSLVGVFEATVGGRWEALNFGVGGYGPGDEELQLREDVLRFSPDAVLLVFFAGNDFRDARLGTDRNALVGGTARLRDDVVHARVPASELVADTTLSRELESSALDRLALYKVLRPALPLAARPLQFQVNHNFTMYTYWSQHPYPPAALAARDDALAAYGRMRTLLDGLRIPFGIVAVPFKEQVYGYPFSTEDHDLDLPQAYVQIWARERHVPFLELLHEFRAHAEAGGPPLFWDTDTHLNDEGHRLAGTLTAAWFRAWWTGRHRAH